MPKVVGFYSKGKGRKRKVHPITESRGFHVPKGMTRKEQYRQAIKTQTRHGRTVNVPEGFRYSTSYPVGHDGLKKSVDYYEKKGLKTDVVREGRRDILFVEDTRKFEPKPKKKEIVKPPLLKKVQCECGEWFLPSEIVRHTYTCSKFQKRWEVKLGSPIKKKPKILKTRLWHGVKEELRLIPLDEIELKEKYVAEDSLLSPKSKERIAKYSKMKTEYPPIDTFGKRFEGDTYQVFNGHHRVLAAKKRGDTDIKAWITPVDRKGRTIRAKPEAKPKKIEKAKPKPKPKRVKKSRKHKIKSPKPRMKMTHIERMHLLASAKEFNIDPQEIDNKIDYYENKKHIHEMARAKGVSEMEISSSEKEAKQWTSQYEEYLGNLRGELEGAGYTVTSP